MVMTTDSTQAVHAGTTQVLLRQCSNVSWYGQFGFEVTETIELTEVPTVWCMTRPAG